MKSIYHYASVSKALEDLYKKGFLIDFNLQDENIKQNPDNYEIVHIYRYEGNSDPGDEAIVYSIKSTSGEKGVLLQDFQPIPILKLQWFYMK
jgi:hypothetical protein